MNDHKISVRRRSITSVETVEVFTHELDSIQRESLDVGQDFQFGSISVTVFVSFLLTLVVTEIPSRNVFDFFLLGTIVSAVTATYCFRKYFREKKTFNSTIQTIRARQIGTLGEEGRELRPAEVAQLPVSAANTVVATLSTDAVLVRSGDVTVATSTAPLGATTSETEPPQTGAEK